MGEPFVLEVEYKGELKEYQAELRVFGYTYKIAIQINEKEIIFEPDEERNYRALISENEIGNTIDRELLRTIILKLESVFK